MKNRLLTIMLAICLLATCGFVFTACADTHKHEFSTEYSFDATHHWFECTGKDCKQTNGKAEHVYDKEVIAEKYLKSVANCAESALYFKSCVCGAKGEQTFSHGEKDSSSHVYGKPTYTWSTDKSSCTAERICSHEASHKDTATAVVTSQVTQAQGCETDEITTYTATFDKNGYSNQTATEKTKEKLGHNYSQIDYKWSADGLTCVAEAVCANDKNHKVTENGVMTNVVTQQKTCENDELSTMTATFQNSLFNVQNKENVKTANKLGHAYSGATYNWSTDHSTCVAEKVCSRDASHKITENGVVTSQVTQAQGCETDEITTYTATFENANFATQTEQVKTADALGHSMQRGEIWTYDEHNHWRECENGCGKTEGVAPHQFDYETHYYGEYGEGERSFECYCGASTSNFSVALINEYLSSDMSYANADINYTISSYTMNGAKTGSIAYNASRSLYFVDNVVANNSFYLQSKMVDETQKYYMYGSETYHADPTYKKTIKKKQYDDTIDAFANLSHLINLDEDLQNKQDVEYYFGEDAYYYNLLGSETLYGGVTRTYITIDYPQIQRDLGRALVNVRKEFEFENGKIVLYKLRFNGKTMNSISVSYSANFTMSQATLDAISAGMPTNYLFNVTTNNPTIYGYLYENGVYGTKNIFPTPSTLITTDEATQFKTLTLELPEELLSTFDLEVKTKYMGVTRAVNANVGEDNVFVIDMPFAYNVGSSNVIFEVFVNAIPKTTNLTIKINDNAEDDIHFFTDFGTETELPSYMAIGENVPYETIIQKGKIFLGFSFDNPAEVGVENATIIQAETTIAINSVIYAVYEEAQVVTLNVPYLEYVEKIILDDNASDFYNAYADFDGGMYIELSTFELNKYEFGEDKYYSVRWYWDSKFTNPAVFVPKDSSNMVFIGNDNCTLYGKFEKYGTIGFNLNGEMSASGDFYYTDYFKMLYGNDFEMGYNAMIDFANGIFETTLNNDSLMIEGLYTDAQLTQKWSSCGCDNITLYVKAVDKPSVIIAETGLPVCKIDELLDQAELISADEGTPVMEVLESLIIGKVNGVACAGNVEIYVDETYTTKVSAHSALPSVTEDFYVYVKFVDDVKGVYYDSTQINVEWLFDTYEQLANLYSATTLSECYDGIVEDMFGYFVEPQFAIIDVCIDKDLKHSIKDIHEMPTTSLTLYPKIQLIPSIYVSDGDNVVVYCDIELVKNILASSIPDYTAADVYADVRSYYNNLNLFEFKAEALYLDEDFTTLWDGVLPVVATEDIVLFAKFENVIYLDDSVYTPNVKCIPIDGINDMEELSEIVNQSYGVSSSSKTRIFGLYTDAQQTVALESLPTETVTLYPLFDSTWIIDGASKASMIPMYVVNETFETLYGKTMSECTGEELRTGILFAVGCTPEEIAEYLDRVFVDKEFSTLLEKAPEEGEDLVLYIKYNGPVIYFSDMYGEPVCELVFAETLSFGNEEMFESFVKSTYYVPFGFKIELYLDEARTIKFTEMPTENVTLYAKFTMDRWV